MSQQNYERMKDAGRKARYDGKKLADVQLRGATQMENNLAIAEGWRQADNEIKARKGK